MNSSSTTQDGKTNAQNILESFGKDFRLMVNWDFTTWVPFGSNFLPSDTCTIYCKKNFLRMDSTLQDFSNLKWIRGDLTLLADFNHKPKPKMYIMDNK